LEPRTCDPYQYTTLGHKTSKTYRGPIANPRTNKLSDNVATSLPVPNSPIKEAKPEEKADEQSETARTAPAMESVIIHLYHEGNDIGFLGSF
jgi:hypothetical protein